LADVGWYGAAYQLASGTLQPLTGKLYVNFKNKWVFISFFALFELGSLICGVATSSSMLIIGRAIQGMGTAGLQNGAFTIIPASVPLIKRPGLIGTLQGISQLGAVIGPLVGGALTQYSTYVMTRAQLIVRLDKMLTSTIAGDGAFTSTFLRALSLQPC
jgi:MFS family permease